MRKAALAVGALVGLLLTGISMAADDPIAQRRLIMQKVLRAENAANAVILGKFRPEKAVKAMKTLQDLMATFPALFPKGSELGGETNASPRIWSEMQQFQALAARAVVDAKAAEAAVAGGQDAFTLAWQVVAEGCNSCHDKYHNEDAGVRF